MNTQTLNDENVDILEDGERRFIIVGTAHVSKASADWLKFALTRRALLHSKKH